MRKSNISIGKIVILLFIFFPFLAFSAANTVPDAVYLEKEIIFTLNPDGSWVKDYHHQVKLDSYYAINRTCGETFIVYNPQYQELEILKAETTMKDGRKVSSPANALNEVLPSAAHYFSHYAHLREMVVTHTALERGAIVDLHYRLKTKPDFMPYFSAREFITDQFPVKRLVLKIAIPVGQELNYHLFNVEGQPKKETNANKDIYTFTFENLESFIEEPLAKDIGHAFIVFSTAPSWENVFPSVDETDPMPGDLAKKLQLLKTSPNTSVDEFYFNLQKLVSEDMANCNIGFNLNGFALRKLQDIFDTNYGTAIEKAYWLYHILKHLDMPAEIIALPVSGSDAAQDVPTLLQFDGFLVKTKGDDDEDIYLNPWKNSELFYPVTKVGTPVYNLQEKKFTALPANSDYQNAVNISGKIKIGKDNQKAAGELILQVSGYFYPYRSMLEDAKKALLKLVKGVMPVSSLEIKKISLLSPGKLIAVVSVEGDFLKTISSSSPCLVIEKCQMPYVSQDMISITARKYPLHLDFPFQTQVNLELEVPENLEIIFLSPHVKVKNETGLYEQQVLLSKPGIIGLKMIMFIEKPVIVSQAYQGFQEILGKYFIKEPLVIAKKKG